MAWAGSANAPGPFNFRGCDLTARIPSRHGGCPGAIPGNRTNFHRPCASSRNRVSKTQFARGSTETACHLLVGPWLKSEAPALQAVPSGSVTRRTPPISRMRGNRSASRFALLIRLPPTAGVDIKTSQPTAVDGAGIDAQCETKVQDLTRSLRRVTADDALA